MTNPIRSGRQVVRCCGWVVGLLILTGCSGAQISLSQNHVPTPALASFAVASSPVDLAVLDVDFDPPLEHLEWVERDQINLLVAIINEGEEVATDVMVTVRLVEQEEGNAEPALMESSQVVVTLAPDEVAVVRFQPLSLLSFGLHYRLVASVEPQSGETLIANNERVFDITIGAE